MLLESVSAEEPSHLTTLQPCGGAVVVTPLLAGRLGIAVWREDRQTFFVSPSSPVRPAVVTRHLLDAHPPALRDETWEVTFCEADACEQARQWIAEAAALALTTAR